jgi:hypothetical protein
VLQKGTSWSDVSSNVRKLVDEWEHAGKMGDRQPATRKEAIREAIALSLRQAGRRERSRA